jgi:23S rRNA (adenine2503-C2)-methyltransferase
MVKTDICGLTAEEIYDLVKEDGFSFQNAVSIANSIYKKSLPEFSLIQKIPSLLRKNLNEKCVIGLFPPVTHEISADNSVKYLFRHNDKEFEAVYIPDKKRHTVCVSTQSGCRMGCAFCETARYGFRGDLTAGEIVNQVISIPEARKITHVVFMGMGEPMDNLENVLKACTILSAEWGLAVSSRNITVSTVGIVAGVREFLGRSDCNLTVSLFSPFAEERRKFVPAEKLNPVYNIIDQMKGISLKKKRRLSIAYIMMCGINDSDRHLEELRNILEGSEIRVNLIPYHAVLNESESSTPAERMQYFKHTLVNSGISASIRKSRGSDISAACGLLAARMK